VKPGGIGTAKFGPDPAAIVVQGEWDTRTEKALGRDLKRFEFVGSRAMIGSTRDVLGIGTHPDLAVEFEGNVDPETWVLGFSDRVDQML